MVTHRPSILQQVDAIAFMRAGQLAAFGPRDEVLQALNKANQPAQPAQPTTVLVPAIKGGQPA
jgi:ATP-binding cassette subfamily C exporter for protease/lipase